MPTNVPQPTWTPQGFVAPLESAILAGVQQDINAAFGGVLNFGTSGGSPTNATPQGQLATSMAAEIGNVNDTFLYFVTQVDPLYSQGRMHDAIGRIYFIERVSGQPTAVQCTLTGLVGTVVPAGALAQDVNGNIYSCSQTVVIPGSGNISVTFECTVLGPVVCGAGALNTIYQTIPGWDEITNPTAGVEGSFTETDSAFERRRSLSTASNALGWADSMLGAVLSVPGVIDAFVFDNASNSTTIFGGVSLAPNSVYVAVLGGTAAAVALAIWQNKPPGCSYNGNTTVVIADPNPLYTVPPTYSVTFEVPNPIPFVINVNVANLPSVPSNALTLVQNAIVASFAGQDGGIPARIGQTVYASRFYANITAQWLNCNIIDIFLGSINAPAAVITGTISGNVLTVAGVTSGAVAIGQTIDDTTNLIIPGTTIVSGSGTSWNLSTVNNIPAAETIYCVVPTLFEQAMQINQIAVISAGNITLTLT